MKKKETESSILKFQDIKVRKNILTDPNEVNQNPTETRHLGE